MSEAEQEYEQFGYSAEMSLWDEQGRCRCPGCGKYRKRTDIPRDQATAHHGGDSQVRYIIHCAPVCKFCLTPTRASL